MDWSPLQDKELFILVSNHSGNSLESAALQAKYLKTFLAENVNVTAKLLVMPVEYGKHRMQDFNNVEDILDEYQNNPPQINSDDLLVLETESEIEKFFQKAETVLNKQPEKWWSNDTVTPEVPLVIKSKKSKNAPIDYIMRPILARKEVTMLYAELKAGKSSLAYSIAAV